MKKNHTVEVVVDSITSALNAQSAGADRVELCDNLFEGGTTPSAGCIEVLRKHLNIDLHVMIRPRGGDFLYSDVEYDIMKKDIDVAKKLGANAVVFGLLTREGNIDKNRTSELLALSYPMSVTFHRAFDSTVDPFKALEDLMSIGIPRLLTSGQEKSALEGAEMIKSLVKQSNENIIIMAGAGIKPNTIKQLVTITNCKEYHFSAKESHESPMMYKKNVTIGNELFKNEYTRNVASTKIIRDIISELNKARKIV